MSDWQRPYQKRENPEIPRPEPQKYFDEKGILRVALVDEEAEKIAKECREVSNTQIRRFYSQVMNFRRRIELAQESQQITAEQAFEKIKPEIRMLKAKAVYTKQRPGSKMPEVLLRFFINHTAVNTWREFEAFCKHFEAVVAFHRFYGKN
jgi:CRISPR-associated protein Csm2